jgi:hypothetical protein
MNTEKRQKLERIASLAHAINYHHTALLCIPPREANAIDIEKAEAALEKRIEALRQEIMNG